MTVRGIGLFVALAAAGLLAPGSSARSATHMLSGRFGFGLSALTGDLATVYPRAGIAGDWGLTYRWTLGSTRLRSGLDMATRSGSRKVTDWIVISAFGDSFPTPIPGQETWHTQWFEVPLVLERAFGARWAQRPYLGAGLLLDGRIRTSVSSAPDAPRGSARRFGLGTVVAAGLELPKSTQGGRIELSYGAGVRSLYGPKDGPSGSWQSLKLSAEVDLW